MEIKGKQIRKYEQRIDNKIFIVEVIESENARETVKDKIKRLILSDCDKLILGNQSEEQTKSLEG